MTSSSDGHSHHVLLSEAELFTVTNGGSVTVTTTLEQGHTHDVSVKKGAIRSQPSPITPMPYPV